MTEHTRQEIPQTRGPKIEFHGRLIASDSFDMRGGEPRRMEMEVWETRGGALIAVTRSARLDGQGDPIVAAKVVPLNTASSTIAVRAGYFPVVSAQLAEGEIAEAQRFAVMDHFDWISRARSMVRKQLKWSLKLRVE